jgi:hypothetical protein
LRQIAGILRGYGYDVLNSHIGTIPPRVGASNRDACLEAVQECDYFLGIIRGYYGSGQPLPSGLEDSEISITHAEQRRAIALHKPRAFLVEEKVVNARLLLKPLLDRLQPKRASALGASQWDLPVTRGKPNPLRYNPVIDNLRVIAMYEEALLSEEDYSARHDHWCQTSSVRPIFNHSYRRALKTREGCEQI